MAKKPKLFRGTAQPRVADFRAVERKSADLSKLLAAQNFQSPEEMQKFLMENIDAFNAGAFEQPPVTPLEEAQELMHVAFDAPTPKQRIKLAEEALTVSPDCCDAYILLAREKAKTSTEEIMYLSKAVEVAKKVLGDEFFNEPNAPFWLMHETRPFMRAMDALADAHWRSEKFDEAIAIWEELLQRNPGDNQGIRYNLLSTYLLRDRLDEAQNLLNNKEYNEDDFTHWAYSRALFMFKKHGDCDASATAMKRAFRANKSVVEYLRGKRKFPKQVPSQYGMNSPEEAVVYLVHGARAWGDTPGFADFMAAHCEF